MSGFGTAVMLVLDRPGRLPLHQARPLGECWLTESAEGRVDGCWRCFEMTARQVLQAWPETCGETITRRAARDPNAPVEVVHAIYARDERFPDNPLATALPFASVWVLVPEKRLLHESGYHEFPVLAPRWLTRAGEVYGRGPGAKALADVKMLQRMSEVTIDGAEKVIRPPILVASDGVLDAQIDLRSGGYTMYDASSLATEPIEPLLTGARPDLGEELMGAVRDRIRRAFYADLLQVMQDPKMTATRVIKLESETLRILAPIVGRLQAEQLLEPLIERNFAIALRSGWLGVPPPSLAGPADAHRVPVAGGACRQAGGGARPVADARGVAAVDPAASGAARCVRHGGLATLHRRSLRRAEDDHGPAGPRGEDGDARNQAAAQQSQMQTAIEAAPVAAKLARAAPQLAALSRGAA